MDVGRCHVPARRDWWVHLSLPGPSSAFFAPLLLWKWIAPRKMEKSWPGKKKKACLNNTTEAYLFHLKGEVWGHPPVLPQWHFPTWHSVTFPVKYCWYSCRGIKSMSKRDTSIKAPSLPLHPPPPSLLPSLSLSPSLHHQHSSSLLSARQTQAYMHYLLSAVDLHLQVLEEVVFNLEGLPKILSPRIYGRQTRRLCEWRQLMVLFLSRNSKIKTAVRLQHTCRREQNGLIQVSYTAGWKNIHLYEPTACRS